MRRLLFFVLVGAISTACTEVCVDDLCGGTSNVSPETIYVSLEDDDTRVQLDANGKTVWTAGDELTAFYKSDANSRFAFRGNTGDRNGGFTIKEQGTKTMDIDEVILIYPYSDKYKLNTENRVVEANISAVQYYEAGSYGVGANLMASVETDDNFTLKSLCGWIAVQLKGAGKVTSITLTGNNGEQLAGDVKFNYDTFNLELLYYPNDPDDSSQVGGSLIFGDYQQTITLECSEGVDLHYTEPTAFYFVVAPQTFAKGITIEATCSDGTVLTKSSSNTLTVERNHIVPMSTLTVMESVPSNQIWYTTTDEQIVEPQYNAALGVTLQTNIYANGRGVMTFDRDVTEIKRDVFEDCSTLSSITLPDCVTTIEDWAFAGCESLKSVVIPKSVKSIGQGAFYECSSLTSCVIPDGVTSIEGDTFSYCESLESVTIPNSVTSIGIEAFYACESLESVTIPDNVTSIGDKAFCECENLTCVKIGNSVTSIGELAFFQCAKLADITLPAGITTIAYYSFAGCESLTSIIIPDTVTTIEEAAFSCCINITSIHIPNSVTTIGDGAFLACYKLNSVILGVQVTSIGSQAFSECALTSITIPYSVESIGEEAFAYCFALKRFSGKFATSDGCCLIVDDMLIAYAMNCGKTEYTIPNGVTTISEGAFQYCVDLTSVTIPDSVTAINDYAFWNCELLKDIYCKATTPPTVGEYSVFSGCASDLKIYVPTESVDLYKSAERWSTKADIIYGYDF